MKLTRSELERVRSLPGGWPSWAVDAPYKASAYPHSPHSRSLDYGANCQRYAYAVLGLFGRQVPPYRSSELWREADFSHPMWSDAQEMDLALFAPSDDPWGAHVAVVFGERLLHLCTEEGVPALWDWRDFEERDRYSHRIGLVRVPSHPVEPVAHTHGPAQG